MCSGFNRRGESLWAGYWYGVLPFPATFLCSEAPLGAEELMSFRRSFGRLWAASKSSLDGSRLDTVPPQLHCASRACDLHLWKWKSCRMVLKMGRLVRRGFCRCWYLPADFFGKKIIWIYCSEDLIILLLNGLYRSIRTLFNVLLPEKLPSQKNTIFFIFLIFTAKQKLGLKRELLFWLWNETVRD